MSKQQKLNALIGFVFGILFQITGYMLKERSAELPWLYSCGFFIRVMGFFIQGWGGWHIVKGKKLPIWVTVFSFHVIGFIILAIIPGKNHSPSLRRNT